MSPQSSASTDADQQKVRAEIAQRAKVLQERIRQRASATMDKKAQKELAAVIRLIPEVTEQAAPDLMTLLETATESLLGTTANLSFAKELRAGIERQLLLKKKVRSLVLGLATGAYGVFVLGALASVFVDAENSFLVFQGETVYQLALVAIAGALGAVVSVATRLRDLTRLEAVDAQMLLYTGFFKPLIGISFALFVYVALNSGILSVTIAEGKENFFFAAVAFVAGFSERLAKDVISRVEGVAGPAGSKPPEAERPTVPTPPSPPPAAKRTPRVRGTRRKRQTARRRGQTEEPEPKPAAGKQEPKKRAARRRAPPKALAK